MKKVIEIETDEQTMLKIDRFLSWLHLNGNWGHSGSPCIDFDGDGPDGFKIISGIDYKKHAKYISKLRGREKRVEYIGCDKQKDADDE